MAARITLQSYLKAPKTASLANGIKNTRTIATFKVPAVNNEPNVSSVVREIGDTS